VPSFPPLLTPAPTAPPWLQFFRAPVDVGVTGAQTQVDGKAGFGSTSGDNTSNTAQVTLPEIRTAGAVLIQVSVNSGTGSCGNPLYNGADDGYTSWASNPNISGSTLENWLFYKDVTPADSGKVLTFALSTARRWTAGGVFLPGFTTLHDLVVAATSSATTLTHIVIPGGTPTKDDSVWVGLAAQRNNTTTPSKVDDNSMPPSWLEDADVSTVVPSAPQFLVWIGHKQLVGQSGVAQTDVNQSSS
jgi:hypothetical protein